MELWQIILSSLCHIHTYIPWIPWYLVFSSHWYLRPMFLHHAYLTGQNIFTVWCHGSIILQIEDSVFSLDFEVNGRVLVSIQTLERGREGRKNSHWLYKIHYNRSPGNCWRDSSQHRNSRWLYIHTILVSVFIYCVAYTVFLFSVRRYCLPISLLLWNPPFAPLESLGAISQSDQEWREVRG